MGRKSAAELGRWRLVHSRYDTAADCVLRVKPRKQERQSKGGAGLWRRRMGLGGGEGTRRRRVAARLYTTGEGCTVCVVCSVPTSLLSARQQKSQGTRDPKHVQIGKRDNGTRQRLVLRAFCSLYNRLFIRCHPALLHFLQ